MNEEEFFMEIAEDIEWYLNTPKAFMPNPERIREINNAFQIAKQLFPEEKVYILDDPLQTGSLFLCIEGYGLQVTQQDFAKFFQIIHKANNFEFYAIGNEIAKLSLTFNRALILCPAEA